MAQFSGTDITCVRGERRVFSGLNYTLEDGGALVLVGPNGSGKSSLLRLMAGLLRPYEGQLTWSDEVIHEDPEAHNAKLHYVGHLDAVKPVLNVIENILFWAELRQGRKGFGVEPALEALGISHLGDVPGRYLSAGQKRRVNLSRLLAAPAPLWLLDEPTTALDAQAIKSLADIIAKHRQEGGMVVVSTHTPMDLPDAEILNLGDFTGGDML
ncbi:MAG: heme ABC exporter ATP-binding protein CcmA [Rhodospirillaceae bacterium]|jgi:heme exporter protein A|nr:heme ABC exporter ATP-binding protein CcmA [Rhodospirillales bacterium]MBT3905490.1 heme ABC exporter ATP-binding protein CcmA [Rhodospirillaceae bacterium]MBT4700469.1 heme ABC exporter ATP-binding protein CcmA [Rhodospirillaceae bacterium]MBT5036543.1 heme ABC exporter ATP-binding protein CcmA [Rhodospirillaceae bacterium]MBT6220034.1 heme ABC exporter ATP-binding protein CcmA [Rhodospirillaceae bacterium]